MQIIKNINTTELSDAVHEIRVNCIGFSYAMQNWAGFIELGSNGSRRSIQHKLLVKVSFS